MKIANIVITVVSVICIGFVLFFSITPKTILNTGVMLGGFIVPIILILITMILEIKRIKDSNEKERIRKYWLFTLFIIYCLLLITVLFLNNQYRRESCSIGVANYSIQDNLKTINIIPFSTIIGHISGAFDHNAMSLLNLFVNLILLAPMGFFIPILFRNKIDSTLKFIGVILIVTVFIEIAQFFTLKGSADIDDVILNTLGSVLTYLAMQTKIVKKMLNRIFDIEIE